jgi:hypothetical protein
MNAPFVIASLLIAIHSSNPNLFKIIVRWLRIRLKFKRSKFGAIKIDEQNR